MQHSKPEHVAIIGAGPSGLLLALCLSNHGIRSTIYESRGPDNKPSGGVSLTPNSLRLLDMLGIYAQLLPRGFEFESNDIVDEAGETHDRFYFGHKHLYGYKALRIARSILLEQLTALVKEKSQFVTIHYNARFAGTPREADGRVSFDINGQTHTADVLIGADGIHSRVRAAIDASPLKYGGLAAIASIIPRSEIHYSRPDHPLSAAVRGKPGALLIVPEDAEARTSIAAIQRPHPELDRQGWEALQEDKSALKALLRGDVEKWGDMGRSLIEAMCRHEDKLLVWPFYQVGPLENWASTSRRVVLIGDAAHAILPSSGQGVNQAIEDVFSLPYLLGAIRGDGKVTMESAVEFWQSWRQERIREIMRVVDIINIKRLPEEERKKHTEVSVADLDSVESGEGTYAWLFNTRLEEEMDAWIASR